jgi:hypothetical protein
MNKININRINHSILYLKDYYKPTDNLLDIYDKNISDIKDIDFVNSVKNINEKINIYDKISNLDRGYIIKNIKIVYKYIYNDDLTYNKADIKYKYDKNKLKYDLLFRDNIDEINDIIKHLTDDHIEYIKKFTDEIRKLNTYGKSMTEYINNYILYKNDIDEIINDKIFKSDISPDNYLKIISRLKIIHDKYFSNFDEKDHNK